MPTPTIERHITPDDLTKALHDDVRSGLTGRPKSLPPKWLYDAHGSELFERITELDEYYLTGAEREVLARHAPEIAAASRAETFVELGSGSSEKTRLLLDALTRGPVPLRRYVPVDVSESALVEAVERIAGNYPELLVHGMVDDFSDTVRALASLSPVAPAGPDYGGGRLVAVLGSTIGNLEARDRASFLAELRAALDGGDSLLLGTDLVKDRARLLAAYNDPGGVTAEFERNVLRVVNRELGADFSPESFDYVARWDTEREYVEMLLRSRKSQVVRVPALDLDVEFEAGEPLRTEISSKFRREKVEAELGTAGFRLEYWWTDPYDDYAMSLAVPACEGEARHV